jgi:carbon monoxide dehydrogenase subunit G
MAPIVAAAEVNRQAEDVFAYVTDPTHFSEWQSGLVNGRMDGDNHGAIGAKCITVRRIGGAERASTSELVHVDPPRSWSVRGVDGPIRAAVDVTVEPLGASTARVEVAVDFTGHGIGKLLVPLVVRREARKEMPGNIARLKERLERR